MSDAATAYTHDFIRSALPSGARRVLEIGCGDGRLAARLQADGFQVVALDADEDWVSAAAALGVDARLGSWPCPVDGLFDAILFTRSLHHVGPLSEGVTAAFASVSPRGRVIVEDFDFAFADGPTFEWFAGLLRVVRATGLSLADSELLEALTAGESEPLEIWHDQHHHDLHSAAAIEAALRAKASSLTADGAAYFFRYVDAASPRFQPVAEALLVHEMQLIRLGRIEALGRRFVAQA